MYNTFKCNANHWDKRDKPKPIPSRQFTFSQCLSYAALYERLAYVWASRLRDRAWQARFPGTTRKWLRNEAEMKAKEAAVWYERAQQARLNGVAVVS